MAQYIDKCRVVAEIKERIDRDNERAASYPSNSEHDSFYRDREKVYKSLLHFLDTLEVKEVNLEKEAELIANGIMIGVQANKYHTNVYNTKSNDFNHSHLMFAARKGIELGLKLQKGE